MYTYRRYGSNVETQGNHTLPQGYPFYSTSKSIGFLMPWIWNGKGDRENKKEKRKTPILSLMNYWEAVIWSSFSPWPHPGTACTPACNSVATAGRISHPGVLEAHSNLLNEQTSPTLIPGEKPPATYLGMQLWVRPMDPTYGHGLYTQARRHDPGYFSGSISPPLITSRLGCFHSVREFMRM